MKREDQRLIPGVRGARVRQMRSEPNRLVNVRCFGH